MTARPNSLRSLSYLLPLLAGSLGLVASGAFGQDALGTSFTFQGELAEFGAPVTGRFDARFRLLDAAAVGNQVGLELCADNLEVVNGRFTVSLDFGAQFSGQARYLEVRVRADTGLACGNASGFTVLAPRQQIAAAPYALNALSAGSAATLAGLPPTHFTSAANLTGALPGGGLSGTYFGPVNLSNTNNSFVGNGAGLTGLDAKHVTTGVLSVERMPEDWAAGGALTGVFPNPALADGAVSDAHITDVSWSKVVGVPDNVRYATSAWTQIGGNQPVVWGTLNHQVPPLPPGLSYSGASAGQYHCVAQRSDGALVAWGENFAGQTDAPPPEAMVRYHDVSAGGYHTLALRNDNVVIAWGDNGKGQCNVPPFTAPAYAVAAGGQHSVALLFDGTIAVWGWDSYGQLDVPPPPGPGFPIAAAAGDRHTLVLYDFGLILAWGDNGQSQCDVPPLPDGTFYTAVAAGGEHSLALRSDGEIITWGNGTFGRTSVPALPPGVQYIAIGAGAEHSLARRSDGSLVAWGRNNRGQCNVPPLAAGQQYVAMDGGGDFSIAERFEWPTIASSLGIAVSGEGRFDSSVRAAAFIGDGAGLTNLSVDSADDAAQLGGLPPAFYLDAANLAGTLPDAALSPNVPRLDAAASEFTGTLSATAFIGDGSGLTGIDASDALTLGGQGPSYYTDASNLTGTLPDARLSANVPRLDAAETGFGGIVAATAFIGDGSGLTGIDASDALTLGGQGPNFYTDAGNLTGVLPDARLSANVPRLDAAATAFGGAVAATAFIGDGSGLSGINTANALMLGGNAPSYYTNAGNLTGTLPGGSLAGTYGAPLTFSNAGNVLSGNGASLTGLNAASISAGALNNARTSGTAANSPNTLVLRDAAGNFSAGTITGTFSGTHTGSGAGLTGLDAGNITSGAVANVRTSGTSANNANTLVLRDGSGNFAAGTITGAFSGTHSGLGAGLTGLDAGAIASGTLAAARLPANWSAGGDLTGSFPSPTIAANAVTDAKVSNVGWGKIIGVPSSILNPPWQVKVRPETPVVWGSLTWGVGNVPTLPAGVSYTSVGMSFGFCGALRSDGQIVVWGNYDDYNQPNVPPLPAGLTYTALAVGGYHLLALRSDGAVVTWGGRYSSNYEIPALPAGTTYTAVAAGGEFSIALRSDGMIAAWGLSIFSQSIVPALQQGLTYTGIGMGDDHCYGIRSDGSMVLWGQSVVQPPALPAGVRYIAAEGGYNNHAALRSDGQIVAWAGGASQNNVPALPAGVTYTALSAGGDVFAALRSDGAVVTWGDSTGVVPALPQDVFYTGVSIDRDHAIGLRGRRFPDTLEVQGASNIVMAAGFAGDGAGLTGLNAASVTSGILATARIPDLDAAKITSGTLAAGRIPDLDAAKITTGTLPAARLTGVSGAGLTNLNAANIATGVLPVAQLPAAAARRDAANTFGAFTNTFAGNVGLGNPAPETSLDVAPGAIIGSSVTTGGVHGDTNRQTKASFGYAPSGLLGEFVGMRTLVKSGTNGCGNSGDIRFDTWECITSPSREVMRITGRGNVGIGTNAPAAPLHVHAGNYGFQQTDGARSLATFLSSSSNMAMFGTVSNHALGFFVNNATPNVFVSTNGYLGIGTSQPGTQFACIGNGAVSGSFSKGSGTFKIDHPLDPENKFLYHSFVESPDMMNVYNGNITTDEAGYAIIDLPAYFEALNKDFRYQVTVVDDGEQLTDFVLARIVKKIEGNRFTVKSSVPNVEVSWQVTGIRKDAFAEKNRIVPEVEKAASEKGKYLHPAAFDLPAERGIYPPIPAMRAPALTGQ